MQQWTDRSPRQWQEFVNHEVCVTASDQQRFNGRVFTVDPVSGSVVLVSFPDHGRPSVRVVLGHAVGGVEVISGGTEETHRRMRSLFLLQQTQTLSADELKTRRENLRAWLEKNRVPVAEDGELLRVAKVLTIGAPYGPGDCSCANEIILARVQALVESHPGAAHG